MHTLIAPCELLGHDYQQVLEETFPGLEGMPAASLRLPTAPYLRALWLVGDSDRAWATSISPMYAVSPVAP